MTLTKFNEIVNDLRNILGKQGSLAVTTDGTDKIIIHLNDDEDMFVCHFTFKNTLLMRNGKVEFMVTFIESDYERQHCEASEKKIAKMIVKQFEQEN